MRLAHVLGASRLAASVLPLSTAYALCGAFGWERGVSYSRKQAPVFDGLYTVLIALAAAFVLAPGLPLIPVIVATQTLNGLWLPVVRLANDQVIMRGHTTGTSSMCSRTAPRRC
jgi:Mn2+/Fe2+ NRAMP family transporter